MRQLTIFSLFLLFIYNPLFAQQSMKGNYKDPIIPEKSSMFANDIYLNNQPSQDQRTLAICSAFNGWLYAAYAYPVNNSPWVSILRSTDNGKTWSMLLNALDGLPGDYFIKIDLIACGNDTSNLKLFFGELKFNANSNIRHAAVSRLSSMGEYEHSILGEASRNVTDLALSSDYMYPASNSNPYSIAAVYTLDAMFPQFGDSIIFRSSSNGGYSFDNFIRIAGSANYLHKVALAYGRSLTYNSGRYFVAWEEKLNSATTCGHIYTAHTEPNFNSPLTTPHLLDTDPSLNNKVRNPSIACQFSASDNDSSNLTEVVFCEQNIPAENRFDIAGFCNNTATVSNNFQTFSISSSQNNKLQPNVCFNSFDSTFMMTYFDSTIQKLPYLTNNVNLQNPYNWNVTSAGYNDSTNLIAPYPKITLDLSQQTGANAWIAERSNGNGAAMFDAPFNYPVGIKENQQTSLIVNVFPNPATKTTTIQFYLTCMSDVRVSLINSLGQSLENKLLHDCPKGQNQIIIDVSHLPSGMYLINLNTYNYNEARKLVIK